MTIDITDLTDISQTHLQRLLYNKKHPGAASVKKKVTVLIQQYFSNHFCMCTHYKNATS